MDHQLNNLGTSTDTPSNKAPKKPQVILLGSNVKVHHQKWRSLLKRCLYLWIKKWARKHNIVTLYGYVPESLPACWPIFFFITWFFIIFNNSLNFYFIVLIVAHTCIHPLICTCICSQWRLIYMNTLLLYGLIPSITSFLICV